MNTLLTITDLLATGENLTFPEVHKKRFAARAVVTDSEERVALLYIGKGQFHKLPGGGVEKGEDLSLALERELLEEIGCLAEVTGEIGIVEEKRSRISLLQTSYCFKAYVVGKKGEPDFTEEEIADGASIVWADSLGAAISILESDQPVGWEGHFIVMRDLAFLKAAGASALKKKPNELFFE